jgi:hypothetical protein
MTPSVVVVTFSLGSTGSAVAPQGSLLELDNGKTDFGARDDKASAVSGGVRDDKASSAPLLSPTGSGVERLLFVDLGLAKLLGVLAREPWLN